MEYPLNNPSDPYTFIAEDFETAVLVVFLLGAAYGAEPKDGAGEEVPISLFGGAEEWYAAKFGRNHNDGLEAKKDAVAAALESFMLGRFEDRQRYEAALSAITEPEKKEQFIKVWQDGCSSLNNIGEVAHKYAKLLKSKAADNSMKGKRNDAQ